MQKKVVSYRKKIAFVKETAKDVLALRKDIKAFNEAYSKLETSFNNPKSVFDPKKVKACAQTLNKQMEHFQNKLASYESKFREALSFGVPTNAIEETTHKLANLISKVALLKAVAETSLGEEMLEIDDEGYLIESNKCGEKTCETKKASDDMLEIDDDGYLIESKKDTKKLAKDEEETEAKEDEEAPKAEETEEAPKAEETEEAPKAEEVEEVTEEESVEEELPSEEDKPVTQEELEEINEDVMAEIFGLNERIENVEEQLGIEPTVNASVKASRNRVQSMKLASASKKQTASSQDVLDTIINMEIH